MHYVSNKRSKQISRNNTNNKLVFYRTKWKINREILNPKQKLCKSNLMIKDNMQTNKLSSLSSNIINNLNI